MNANLDDDEIKTGVYQQALSTIVQTVNDYNGNVTVTSPDLWLDPPVFADHPYVANQEVDITVDVHDRGIYGKKSTIELKSLDGVLAHQDLAFNYDGDQKITLSYVPTEAGDVDGKIILLPLPDEASQDNNQVDAKFQVGKAP